MDGWQRLCSAQAEAELKTNGGNSYTLEDLNELTGLSAHTLTKVRRRQNPVDRQTLENYFQAFDLDLTTQDYTKPMDWIQQTINSDVVESAPRELFTTIDQGVEPPLPEGQVSLHSPFYVRRSPVEASCDKAILQPGALIRIKAPRRMGKSSLLVRILDRAAQQGCKTVFLSLQLADRNLCENLDKFLRWFSASVSLGMELPNRVLDYWDELFGSKISCKIYFEQYLLAKTTQPLVLALDDVDLLFDYPQLADEFFGLLRTWHEQAKNRAIWQKLHLIVAHSTEVYIPLNVNKSPFNVGLPIELKSFDSAQVEYLAEQYGLNWSQRNTEELMAIANGQPYLIQLGLYALWEQDITVRELLQQAQSDRGIYANHLQRLLWTLNQQPQLALDFKKVIQSSEPVALDLKSAYKLESLGLVELQGNLARPSCGLYQTYFGDRLEH